MAGLNQEKPSARASVTRRNLGANDTPQAEQAKGSYRTPARQTNATGTLDQADVAPASASPVGLYVRPPAEVAVPARKLPWATIVTAAAVLAVGALAVIVMQDSGSSISETEVLSANQELETESPETAFTEVSDQTEETDESQETEPPEGTATSAAPGEIEPSSAAAPSTAPAPPSVETDQTNPEQAGTENGAANELGADIAEETKAEAEPGGDEDDETDAALVEYKPSAGAPARLAEANENSTAYSVYNDGEIFLRGRIAKADAERLIASAEAILGPENVFNEFVYDDSVETAAQPFFVEDLVLFDTGGTEIQPDFDVLISAGVLLLQLEPTARIIVLGFTDSIGNADDNIALSEARVQTIIDRAVELGADPAQLEGRGLGEVDPIGDNGTEAGRQQNRRVEFIIEGIIG